MTCAWQPSAPTSRPPTSRLPRASPSMTSGPSSSITCASGDGVPVLPQAGLHQGERPPACRGQRSHGRSKQIVQQALQKPYHDLLFTVHQIVIRFNGWTGAYPDCPFIQLTTLDRHCDVQQVTFQRDAQSDAANINPRSGSGEFTA